MNIVNQVYDSIKWKKSDEVSAQRLNVDLKLYKKIRKRIDDVRLVFKNELDNIMINAAQKQILNLSDDLDIKKALGEFEKQVQQGLDTVKAKVIEFNEDLEKGQATIKGLSSEEPRNPEEIISLLKTDTTKWNLSQYWNKQQPNGMWLISALVSLKKTAQVTTVDIEDIIRTVFQDKTFETVFNYPQISNGKALFVYTSDKHIGAYVNDQRALYKNEYNELTYAARMKLVLHEIYYLKETFGHFEDIFVMDLGDKMDGQNGLTTRGGHKLPQNMNNREAFETCVRVEKEFFDALLHAGVANEYHVIMNANSNHGGDMDYMVSRALEEYINAKYPHVDTHIQEKFIEHFYYGKHCVLYTHGKDDEDLKFGFPRHLNDKTENYLNKYLLKHKINPEEYFVSVIKGDLHINNSEETYGFRYRNAMSLFGASKWVGHNYGPTKPGCSYDIVERNTQRVFEGRIPFFQ